MMGAELDLAVRREDAPAAGECLHAAGGCGTGVGPDSHWEGALIPHLAVPTMLWEPREGQVDLASAMTFQLASPVDSSSSLLNCSSNLRKTFRKFFRYCI